LIRNFTCVDGDTARNAKIRVERLNPGQIFELENTDDKRINTMQKHRDTLINDKLTHFA